MILDDICEHKRGEVEQAKARVSFEEIKKRAADAEPARDFRAALRTPDISLIAEIKRASPSKGRMMEDIDIKDLASLYEDTGASAISILTDEKYFQGTLDDFIAVRRVVNLPCLRKEFIIDPYQIYEARAAGADAILLIVRILTDQQLKEYGDIAHGLGMSVLVETHDEEEIGRAIESDAHIIGVNNRDLSTFDVDVNRTLRLKTQVPGGKVLVSESGIHTRAHVQKLEDGGVDAVLIGESIVTSNDIRAKIRELLGVD